MNDEQALLAAIAANRDDDTLRLAYADHLDELGGEANQAQAEYIRIQVQHYRFPEFEWDSARESYLFRNYCFHWRRSVPGFTIPVYLRRGFPCRAAAPVPAVLAAVNDPFARLFDEFVLVLKGPGRAIRDALRCPILTGVEELRIETDDEASGFRIQWMAASTYPRLKRLILSRLELDDRDIRWLSESTNFPKLEQLDLSVNHISDIGAVTLSVAPFASRLRRLWMSNNNIGYTGNLALFDQFGSVLVDVLPPPTAS